MSEEQKGNAQVELKKLSMHFGSIVAVDDINLRIERGEFVTLLGPSGSGKTTTLSLVAGFMEPTSGRVFMGGRDITHECRAERGLSAQDAADIRAGHQRTHQKGSRDGSAR